MGILRGKAALPELIEADALQRHRRDLRIAGGPAEDSRRIGRPADRFLLHDMDPKVQIAAIQTTGVLLQQGAVAGSRSTCSTARAMSR